MTETLLQNRSFVKYLIFYTINFIPKAMQFKYTLCLNVLCKYEGKCLCHSLCLFHNL